MSRPTSSSFPLQIHYPLLRGYVLKIESAVIESALLQSGIGNIGGSSYVLKLRYSARSDNTRGPLQDPSRSILKVRGSRIRVGEHIEDVGR